MKRAGSCVNKSLLLISLLWHQCDREAPTGTNQMGQTRFCKILLLPAVFCKALWLSAKVCVSEMLENA